MKNKYTKGTYSVTRNEWGMPTLVLEYFQDNQFGWGAMYEPQQRRFMLVNHVWVNAAGHLANFYLEGGRAWVAYHYELNEMDDWWEIDDWTPTLEGCRPVLVPCGRDPPYHCAPAVGAANVRGMPNCESCKKDVDPNQKGVLREAIGWVEDRKQGGVHHLILPNSTGRYIHRACLRELPDQPKLFE